MQSIKMIMVWDKWIRLSHWLMALGISFELLSVWLIKHADVHYAFWSDWHVIVGQALVFVLLLRLVLFVRPGAGNAKVMFRVKWSKVVEMMKFYLSLGRYPLPSWYAHNPFWVPLYGLFLFIFLNALFSGFLFASWYGFAGYSFKAIHAFLGDLMFGFIVLHIVAVFWHDWKGNNASISAMVNGNRYFHIDNTDPSSIGKPETTVKVSLEALKR